ncbi:translesion error-prone DNA polymerase V autoproteolytic subunit [Spirosoma sp. KCTC 42546]|uniref:LexA family protein n=1 Tax=Spirosoma sp. KCTC 42546 TaxID=2520506 RepID=UPI001159362F|nr:translesion error-prone DNA polymerase V autoproteolytic subunit [Spirosoma sp. KCTC 42546]QDK80857.1 translesion error-prone DNA polymerase V autoproteolytic subunit [Spirosoma sp. KCTC 42546]
MIDHIDHIEEGDMVKATASSRYLIPFFSSLVQGGFPSPAENYIEKVCDLNDLCITNAEATYFVRVTGDSMTGDRIEPGDVLIVDCSRPPADGKIVIVWYDGGHAVKRIRYVDKLIVLESSNPRYLPIYVHPGENFSVLGVVTFNLQKF